MITTKDTVIVGYTTESKRSNPDDESSPLVVGNPVFSIFSTDPGDKSILRLARSQGHAFELRQAINGWPKTGPKAAKARVAFDRNWKQPQGGALTEEERNRRVER